MPHPNSLTRALVGPSNEADSRCASTSVLSNGSFSTDESNMSVVFVC